MGEWALRMDWMARNPELTDLIWVRMLQDAPIVRGEIETVRM
jgi:hypothetical protein